MPGGCYYIFFYVSGVKSDLCYGCGRCLPICPLNLIQTESIFITIDTIVEWLDILPIDAIEIHTQEGHFSQFISVWKKITASFI